MSEGRSPGRAAWEQRLAGLSQAQRGYLARLLQDDRTPAEEPRLGASPRSAGSAVSMPCSFAQQRLWFLDRLDPGDPAYTIVSPLRLPGELDADALERSLQVVVARHEVLRTAFGEVDGMPVQVIAPEWAIPLERVDLSHLDSAAAEAAARARASAEAGRAFDLARGPLLRATLLRLEASEHVLLLALHHIITDGWSMGVLFRELTTVYAAESAGGRGAAALQPLPLQYADFALWQREWLSGARLARMVTYWRSQLADLARLELPTDRPRPAVRSGRGASLRFTLSAPLTAGLQALAREEGVTPFMTLLAGFATLLGRYSGQTDVAIGSPIANRTRAELEGLIGFFVNTLVLRVSLAGAPSFRALLARVKAMALDAYAHQDLPFERLVEELQPHRDLSHNPLFDVMMQFQTGADSLHNAEVASHRAPLAVREVSVFDLSLDLWNGPEHIAGQFEYSTALFDAATLTRMVGHFVTLLGGAVANRDRPVTTLPLLTPEEREQMLVAWNATAAPIPAAAMHTLIDAQAARTPDALAVRAGADGLTYAALTGRANQLAHLLRTRGVGPETVVAVCLDRGLDLVVALLGILKAGGAYLPLEPDAPPARIAAILADAGTVLLVTRTPLHPRLANDGPPCLCLEREAAALATSPLTPPAVATDPERLAYVIYTSGSTGTPKGVEITHRSLVNQAFAMAHTWDLRAEDRVLQLASITFDVAAEEIFPALIHGATVCLAKQCASRSPAALVDTIAEERVTIVNLPTPLWEAWMADLCPDRMPTLRLLIIGSEKIGASSYARWVRRYGMRPRVQHAYGVSEATITSLVADLSGLFAQADSCSALEATIPPIGRPIANTEAYVLDAAGEPVPVGVAGELHLGGAGLARGYRGHPELTAARFRPHPFRPTPARLYATGDRVRFRADGQLEFLGRLDAQIKLHGFRIEPAEIEAALRQHPAIADARVIRREDTPGQPRLVAYLVAQGAVPPVDQVTAGVRGQLPAYMVPAAYVWLPRLPLTAHGKLDRAALPPPDSTRPHLSTPFALPRTSLERTIAGVWREVLQVTTVGRDDNFFDLGGRSLLLVRVHALLSARASLPVSVLDLFRHPTIRLLAAYLDAEGRPMEHAPSLHRHESGSAPGSLRH